MKKLYSALILMSLSLVGFSQDQLITHINLEKAKSSPEYANSRGVRVAERADNAERGNQFWSEDFSDSVNEADGTVTTNNGEWELDGPNGDIWKYSTTESNGCWSFNTDIPEFGSADNGFLIFDADSANCINPDTDPPTFNLDVVAGSIISPAIDCSGQTAVALQFAHDYRWCCSELLLQVEVSTDNGATYPNIYELAVGAVNVQANEDIVVNLSAIAPGEEEVRIKFTWNSPSHYYWALDDMFLFVPADNDLTISNNYMGDIIDEVEYTKVPLSQAATLNLGATITNNGGAVAAEAQVAVDVFFNGGTEPVDSDASIPAEIIQGEDSLVWIFTDYTPAAIGDYSVTFTAQDVVEDADPSDNAIEGSIEITEFIYGRDDDSVGGGFPGTAAVEDGEGFSAGILLGIENDQLVYGVDFALTDNTVPGAEMLVQILDPNTENFDPIATSQQFQIWESNYNDIGEDDVQWVTIAFEEPVALTGGAFTMPTITYFGGDGLQIGTAQGNQPEQTAFVFGDFGDAGVDWYFTTTLPMIRLNFTPDLETFGGFNPDEMDPNSITEQLKETGFILNQNIPNPVSDNSYITYELLEAGNVELVLMDVTGKEIVKFENGYKGAGEHRVDFNLGDLAPGVYNYSLLYNNERITKSLLVE
ncbi:MAG: T9SS type A sorting domain-containing protein [Flavobacteriales bacterium]